MRRLFLTTAILAGLNAAAGGAAEFGNDFHGIEPEAEAATETMVSGAWVLDLIDSARHEADELAMLAHGTPADGQIEERVHFHSPEILSILREERAFGHEPGAADAHEGNAGGTLWLAPVNEDLQTGRLIPIQALFGDLTRGSDAYERVASMLRKAAVEQLWSGEPGSWQDDIEAEIQPDPMYLSTYTFVPSTVPGQIGGVAWHFEPGLIAPDAKGAVSVIIPQKDLRNIVPAEWRERFAGEPAGIPDGRYALHGDHQPASHLIARY